MPINPVSGNQARDGAYGQQKAQELTTVTTHCNKQHLHDQSCPHTVTTRPAPRVGEPGYFLDRKV